MVESNGGEGAPRTRERSTSPLTWKRGIDLLGAVLGLGFLAPLFGVLALLGRIQGRPRLLARDRRMGRFGRGFEMCRFHAAGAGGQATILGRLVGRLGLDAAPQLWNVLRGEMSLVGPRPERPERMARWKDSFADVLECRPGIVDPAAPELLREEAILARSRDAEAEYVESILPERLRHSRDYIRVASFRSDLGWIARSLASLYLEPAIRRVESWVESAASRANGFRRAIVIAVHAVVVLVSVHAALALRFEGRVPEAQWSNLWRHLPLLFALRMAAFVPFGLFEGLWRYASVRDMRNIAGSIALSTLAFLLVDSRFDDATPFPISVLLIDALLLGFLLSAMRLTKRVVHSARPGPSKKTRVLIFGAGDAGEGLVREIERHVEYGYEVVGFIDDDHAKKGTSIRGRKVFGARSEMETVLARSPVDEILVAVPSAEPEDLQAIVAHARRFGLPVKMLPGLRDMLFSRGLIQHIRDIAPEDLLCRAPVEGALPELASFYRGKSVLITGAGGSIGSELSRQAARLDPRVLVLFERHEFGLYQIEMEIRRTVPGVRIVPIVGDILDASRVRHVFDEHEPEVIFHAAAYKHVPLMELNPHEAVKVNILGTKNLCEAALRHGVERFVFISSDKAVHPASVMGATKRVGELLLGDYTERAPGRTRFLSVRFGNVLESSGSVVPLFKEQIRRGGPVTVTHPDVRRYFMTTKEAVHLVLNAALLGEGGEVFVLDMGEPIRMIDMARQLIALYGYTPDKDIEIVFTGLRPGEKLEEGLFHSWEEVHETRHPKIRVAGCTHLESHLGPEDERLEAIVERAMSGATVRDVRGLLLDTISAS